MIGFYSLKLAPHDHQGSLYRRVSRYRTVIRALETWPMMLLEIHCQPRSNFIPFGVRYVYAQFYSPRWRLQGSLDIALPNANSSIELTTTIVNFHSILFYRGKHRRIRATISGNFIRWMMIYRDPLIHHVDDIFEFVNFRIYVGIFAIQVSRNFILLRVTVLGIPRYRVTGMVICELINDFWRINVNLNSILFYQENYSFG